VVPQHIIPIATIVAIVKGRWCDGRKYRSWIDNRGSRPGSLGRHGSDKVDAVGVGASTVVKGALGFGAIRGA
jgi:hypothetical protein